MDGGNVRRRFKEGEQNCLKRIRVNRHQIKGSEGKEDGVGEE